MLSWLIAIAALSLPHIAQAGQRDYDSLIATHATANNVPEALVHRVILRESRYQPNLVGRCGCIGLMQIKLATARGLGYTGDAQGLRDPNTNLTYGVKYLAGAYRAANGDHGRAMRYFASGYYEVAKRQRLQHVAERRGRAGHPLDITPKQLAKVTVDKATVEKAPADDQTAASEQVPSR
jgi:soluble lytic murein transglycosylase-like protein